MQLRRVETSPFAEDAARVMDSAEWYICLIQENSQQVCRYAFSPDGNDRLTEIQEDTIFELMLGMREALIQLYLCLPQLAHFETNVSELPYASQERLRTLLRDLERNRVAHTLLLSCIQREIKLE